MFSAEEKKLIAQKVEELLLSLNHPEMPKEKPFFYLKIDGKEGWSWAEIRPNWVFDDGNPPSKNLWNEISRDVLK